MTWFLLQQNHCINLILYVFSTFEKSTKLRVNISGMYSFRFFDQIEGTLVSATNQSHFTHVFLYKKKDIQGSDFSDFLTTFNISIIITI